MYARVITFEVEPEKLADARKLIQQLAPDLSKKIGGLCEFISLVRGDGKIVNISIFDSRSDAYAAVPKIMHVREHFADMGASRPTPEEFEVVIHERVK